MTKLFNREKENKKEGNKNLAFSEIFSIFASIFLLALLLKNPTLVHKSVKRALEQCASFLIPSLFPLMTVSEIITECGTIEYITRPLRKPLGKILGVHKNATSPYFLGLIGGYTTSVGSAISLYKNERITKEDCERIIALSTLPSLAFLTGFVGSGILQSSTMGWILWLLCIISSIVIAFGEILVNKTLRKGKGKNPSSNIATGIFSSILFERVPRKKPFSKIMLDSITHSASAMLIICACVVFFSALTEVLHYPLSALGISEDAEKLILGSLELTNGISSLSELSQYNLKIVFCGFFIGWS